MSDRIGKFSEETLPNCNDYSTASVPVTAYNTFQFSPSVRLGNVFSNLSEYCINYTIMNIVLLFILLIILSAFFSGLETALFNLKSYQKVHIFIMLNYFINLINVIILTI